MWVSISRGNCWAVWRCMPVFKSHSLTHALTGIKETHLQANRQVHSTAKRGANGPWMEAQVFKQFWEWLGECYSGPFFCHHYTGPHAGQVQSSCLEIMTAVGGQPCQCYGCDLQAPYPDLYNNRNSTQIFIPRALCVCTINQNAVEHV